jgi:hypothetical protein
MYSWCVVPRPLPPPPIQEQGRPSHIFDGRGLRAQQRGRGLGRLRILCLCLQVDSGHIIDAARLARPRQWAAILVAPKLGNE